MLELLNPWEKPRWLYTPAFYGQLHPRPWTLSKYRYVRSWSTHFGVEAETEIILR